MITKWRKTEARFGFSFVNEDWGKVPEGEVDLVSIGATVIRVALRRVYTVHFSPKEFFTSDWKLAGVYWSEDVNRKPDEWFEGDDAVELWDILSKRVDQVTVGSTGG